jgi:hypothetical protein
VGVGLAAGAGSAAAMIGMTGAPAARADEVTATDPIGLLDSSTADLTQADDVLSQADVPAQFQRALEAITPFPDTALRLIDQTETAQAPLFSQDDPFSAVASALFGGLDQQFAEDSDAFLTASQAFAADPSATTEFGLVSASLQFDSTAIESILPTIGAFLVDQLFGLGGSDITGGLTADLAATAGPDLAANAGSDLATSFVPDFSL